jgi:7 transmembrane helices usually fused to an inactive transglutaminase
MFRNVLIFIVTVVISIYINTSVVSAQTRILSSPSPSLIPIEQEEPIEETQAETPSVPQPKPDLTQRSEETVEPLLAIVESQKIDSIWPFNHLKVAIRNALTAGVPANTIVLLLLLPVVATFIAAARHLGGVRGFGIFLPAALSVVFLATGAIVGIGLFLVIVGISTVFRMVLKKLKVRLQYLPRMALLLWLVVIGVLGVLFLAPYIPVASLANVSIFPVLILALLAEDFTKAQLGKSVRYAIGITSETLLLALVSYLFLTLRPIQSFALLNPEALLISVAIANILLGQYVGLRLLELWRFRRLIKS